VAAVVKLVVASAVSAEGDHIYGGNWNQEFIQLPLVVKEKQNRPAITHAEISAALRSVKKAIQSCSLYSLERGFVSGKHWRCARIVANGASALVWDLSWANWDTNWGFQFARHWLRKPILRQA
jgi:hypothetical protein